MNKRIGLLVLAIAGMLTANAQVSRALRYWETGLFVGTTNYNGQVASGGDIGTLIDETRPQIGLFLKRNLTAKFNINAELAYGRLYADDNNYGNGERGFIVNTHLMWANIGFDLHFRKFGKYFKRNSHTPYIALSGGPMFYSPRLKSGATYDPAVYDLYPGTHTTYNIMLAFGWKFRMSEHGIFGVSLNYHPTGTNYIEGFQTKEPTGGNNAYYGLRLTFSRAFFAN